jgi:hypothetical protein
VSDRIEQIKRAVERAAGVPADHIQSVPIKETFNGETVWEGVVEEFVLLGHPVASRAYGWRIGNGTAPNYKAVLQVPPINSAIDAVRASIVAQNRAAR